VSKSERVLLVNPRPNLRETNAVEPLPLLTLAAPLIEDPDIDVAILDGAVTNINEDSLMRIIQEKEITHIACTATTPQYPKALKILKWTEQIQKLQGYDIQTVIGGVHATILGEKALEDGWKTVSTLEGDLKIVPIVKEHLTGQVVGGRLSSKALADLPSPAKARHLINPYNYHKEGYNPTITIMGTRGCPYHCIFCDKTIMGDEPRYRPPESITDEIKYVKKKWDIIDSTDYDDTFTLNENRVYKLCELRAPLGINWECNSRVDTINDNLLSAMREAGFWKVKYGLESTNPRVLKSIGKGVTVEQAEEAVRMTKEAKMLAFVYLMFGFPEDGQDSAKDMIKFLHRANPNGAQLSLALPLPNTPLYRQVVRQGQKPPTNLESFHYAGPEGPHTWLKRTRYLDEEAFAETVSWLQREIAEWATQANHGEIRVTNVIRRNPQAA
jgi:anaerobic magnesium-protoporphyrin IX monomethyl ester cyclase